jgi:hypothetical protein
MRVSDDCSPASPCVCAHSVAKLVLDEFGGIAVKVSVPERGGIDGIVELRQFMNVDADRRNAA